MVECSGKSIVHLPARGVSRARSLYSTLLVELTCDSRDISTNATRWLAHRSPTTLVTAESIQHLLRSQETVSRSLVYMHIILPLYSIPTNALLVAHQPMKRLDWRLAWTSLLQGHLVLRLSRRSPSMLLGIQVTIIGALKGHVITYIY